MTEKGILNWDLSLLSGAITALEHATLNLLAKEYPSHPFAGHSDNKGFWVIGDISTDKPLKLLPRSAKTHERG